MKFRAGKHKRTDVLCSFIPHAQPLFMHVLTGTGSDPSALGQKEAEKQHCSDWSMDRSAEWAFQGRVVL